MNEADILSETNQLLFDYYNDSWTSSLFLSNCLLVHNSMNVFPILPTETIDIFSYCKGGSNSNLLDKNWYIRFDPTIYPVPQDLDNSFNEKSAGSDLIAEILKKLRKERSVYSDPMEQMGGNNMQGVEHFVARDIECTHAILKATVTSFHLLV
jgi:hypothetical protein